MRTSENPLLLGSSVNGAEEHYGGGVSLALEPPARTVRKYHPSGGSPVDKEGGGA
jgi:hypothetical protein